MLQKMEKEPRIELAWQYKTGDTLGQESNALVMTIQKADGHEVSFAVDFSDIYDLSQASFLEHWSNTYSPPTLWDRYPSTQRHLGAVLLGSFHRVNRVMARHFNNWQEIRGLASR